MRRRRTASPSAAMEQRLRVAIPARALIFAVAGWLLAVSLDGGAFAQQSGERYFIDFRARNNAHIGHTYLVYFRVDASGHVAEQHHAGLVPEEDVWNGVFSPIRAAIRNYKDDTTMPATVIYRRELSVTEFDRVGRAVRMLK